MSRENLLKLRRGAAATWSNANPVLAAGEPGVETDTNKLKIGDGTTAWNSLSYFAVDGGDLATLAPSCPVHTAHRRPLAPAPRGICGIVRCDPSSVS